ncbi:21265_t:CDS:2, partial [Gigaspora margarita]
LRDDNASKTKSYAVNGLMEVDKMVVKLHIQKNKKAELYNEQIWNILSNTDT